MQQRAGYTWGSRWQRSTRLQAIRYEFDGGSGFSLVHSWSLSYAAPNGSERSRVTSVRQCGPTECLPDTVLGWQTAPMSFQPAAAGATDALADEALFADHDGDGDMDLHVPVVVGANRVWRVRLATTAVYNPYVGTPLTSSVPANGPAYLLEYDGDGRRDLVTAGPSGSPYWFVYRSTGAGFATGLNTGLSTAIAPALLVLDPDGDGLSDLGYFKNGALYYLPNTGSGFAPERSDQRHPVFRLQPGCTGCGRSRCQSRFRWRRQA